MSRFILLIHCPDKAGIISNVTSFIFNRKGNIVYIDQYVDVENSIFVMRLECEFLDATNIDSLKEAFSEELAVPYQMFWRMYSAEARLKMAIFVSKYDHCLYDILGRHKAGELPVDIPLIISNHKDLGSIAEKFDIPFHHIAVSPKNKKEAESKHLELLSQHKINFFVLARYMQIIPDGLIEAYPNRIINIHHSFLPAFAGAKPYHSAYKRGVKIIGATSHYVTAQLDEGPIIEQDITRISHTHSINDLILKGRDLEKVVLARAIKLHIDRKTLVYNNKTIVFI
ncbi:formyltetrahydrofolate deformylase [Salinimicrobium sp. WS361]|uniref:formyltetrahydrofolate deformylase n=1 Tax=Salinimicrobium sp. WS361 TaxID=3425123 RepID=UPI003D6E5CAC